MVGRGIGTCHEPVTALKRNMKNTYDFTKTPDANFTEFFKPKKKASTKAEIKAQIQAQYEIMHQLINEI